MKYAVKFPYNVLKIPVKLDFSQSDESYEYIIKLPDVVFSEAGLHNVNKADLQLVAEVNCSSTMYRKCFHSNDSELRTMTFFLPKKNVNHRFQVDVLLLAKRPLELNGQIIEKGMPLAHFGSNTISLSRNQKGLIVFDKSVDKEITYGFGSDLIKIRIPERIYNDLSRMKNRPEIKHLLASQFAQIALLEACKYLKEDGGKSHLNWYEELLKRWNKFNPEKQYPDSEDHLKLVNYILDYPSLNFANYLIKKIKNDKDEQTNY